MNPLLNVRTHRIDASPWSHKGNILTLRFATPMFFEPEDMAARLDAGEINSEESGLSARIPIGYAALGVMVHNPLLKQVSPLPATALYFEKPFNPKDTKNKTLREILTSTNDLSSKLSLDFFLSGAKISPRLSLTFNDHMLVRHKIVNTAEILLIGRPNHHPFWTID
jgi:hypothetical protein